MQDLPFTIQLNKFIIDFYSTGMPKLFASEVTIRDHETGKTFPATIKVNQPLIYRGVAVYQSSFEDGGSKLKLTGWPMTGAGDKPLRHRGRSRRRDAAASSGDDAYSVEWSGFRPFNVENTSQSNDARAVTKGKIAGANSSPDPVRALGLGRQERQQQGPEKRRPQRAVQAARQDRPGARIP